jgi:hypothetical protein
LKETGMTNMDTAYRQLRDELGRLGYELRAEGFGILQPQGSYGDIEPPYRLVTLREIPIEPLPEWSADVHPHDITYRFDATRYQHDREQRDTVDVRDYETWTRTVCDEQHVQGRVLIDMDKTAEERIADLATAIHYIQSANPACRSYPVDRKTRRNELPDRTRISQPIYDYRDPWSIRVMAAREQALDTLASKHVRVAKARGESDALTGGGRHARAIGRDAINAVQGKAPNTDKPIRKRRPSR